jgi:hypothetical protein
LLKQVKRLLLLPVALTGVATPVTAQEEPAADEDTRNCISTRRLRRVRAIDEGNVLFFYSNRTIFQNTLMQGCSEILHYRISYNSMSGNLCEGDGLTILRSQSWDRLRMPANCKLGTFRKLNPTEVEVVRNAERAGTQPDKRVRPDRVEIGVTSEEPEDPEEPESR